MTARLKLVLVSHHALMMDVDVLDAEGAPVDIYDAATGGSPLTQPFTLSGLRQVYADPAGAHPYVTSWLVTDGPLVNRTAGDTTLPTTADAVRDTLGTPQFGPVRRCPIGPESLPWEGLR